MGINFMGRNCGTNPKQPAPNPNPSRWELIEKKQLKNSYILLVKYLDCTNFEGVKLMVFKGQYKKPKTLDPHFRDTFNSPIARFPPTKEGWVLANIIANTL